MFLLKKLADYIIKQNTTVWYTRESYLKQNYSEKFNVKLWAQVYWINKKQIQQIQQFTYISIYQRIWIKQFNSIRQRKLLYSDKNINEGLNLLLLFSHYYIKVYVRIGIGRRRVDQSARFMNFSSSCCTAINAVTINNNAMVKILKMSIDFIFRNLGYTHAH